MVLQLYPLFFCLWVPAVSIIDRLLVPTVVNQHTSRGPCYSCERVGVWLCIVCMLSCQQLQDLQVCLPAIGSQCRQLSKWWRRGQAGERQREVIPLVWLAVSPCGWAWRTGICFSWVCTPGRLWKRDGVFSSSDPNCISTRSHLIFIFYEKLQVLMSV